MRVQVEAAVSREVLDAVMAPIAERFDLFWQLDLVGRPVRTLVMVSKAGHCLLDLLYRRQQERLPVDIVAVVSNHEDLASVAEFYGVPFHHIPVTPDTKAQAEAQLTDLITDLDVELVVLARYMQILSTELCAFLEGRAINIHHSFLPSFKGARPYAQAHARGVKLIGATAHYVTAALDEGPIIEQDVERVDHATDVDALAALGQDVERRALARAVRWHAERRVLLNGSRTVIFR
jgi:formyltetrahydrofolate deformylase